MVTKGIVVIYLVATFLLMLPSISWSSQALEDEVKALRERVRVLEEKLAEIQKTLNAATPQTADASIVQEPKAFKTKTNDQPLKIGGSFRFNYNNADYDDHKKNLGGELEYNLFNIKADAEFDGLILSADYRWYGFMDVIHHGFMGYNVTDSTQVQLGITQVPFGLLPWASNNWWFGLAYYLGFEDDYDLGIKSISKWEPWNLQLAFFKNAEWGNSGETKRYSYDVVKGFLGQQNEESNQLNVRFAYTFDHGDPGKTEVGISGQWGQLYNEATEENGDHWAAAAHLKGNYGPWGLMLEAISYEFDPENPAGVSDKTIEIGALSDSFLVAAKGMLYIAALSYSLPVDWDLISNLTFYNDYSILVKDEDSFTDSHINTAGCMITSVPIYTYIDFIFGKNALYLGGPRDAFGTGDHGSLFGGDDDWHLLFNINIGYYF